MKYYTIKAMFQVYNRGEKIGFAEFTLDKDFNWSLATNNPQRFKSVGEAQQRAKIFNVVENRPQAGSDTMPFIVGPKGGKHSIFERK